MSPASRRSYLRALGATVTAGASAGCLDRIPFVTTYEPPDHPPTRAQGDPISVEYTFRDPEGYVDGREYFPSNRTIRHVRARQMSGPTEFEDQSFEEWGRIKTAERGAPAVEHTATVRLGTGAGIQARSSTSGDETLDPYVIVIALQARLDEHDRPIKTPEASFEELVDAAPRSADVTVSVESDSFSRTVPVYAEGRSLQLG